MIKRLVIATVIAAALVGATAAGAQVLAVVNTNQASGFQNTQVTLNGYVDPQGTSDTYRWFEWGQTTSLGNTTNQVNNGSGSGSFNQTISGLSEHTTYYFRAVASNGAGTVRGQIFTFSTIGNSNGSSNSAPTVSTNAPSGVSQTSATLNGYVNPNGTSGAVSWFEWGTSTGLGNSTNQISQSQNPINFNLTISGLTPNTTYFYRAAARNAQGTTYGSTMSFTTSANVSTQATTATTRPATLLTSSGAVLNGYGTADNNISSEVWFEWGKTTGLGNATKPIAAGYSSTIDFSNSMIGLSPNTTYYFRAVVQNSRGTIRGSIVSFHTLQGSTPTHTPTPTPVPTPKPASSSSPAPTSRPAGTTAGTSAPTASATPKPTSSISITHSVSNQSTSAGQTGASGTEAIAAGGETVLYTIHIENTGSADVMNMIVKEHINPYVDFVSASDNGTFDENASAVTWKLSFLHPKDSKDVTLTVRAKSFPQQTIAEASATVRADKIAEQSSNTVKLTINPQNGSSVSGTTHSRSAVTLSITAPKDVVKTDEKINFTIKYRNEGNDVLSNSVLALTMPAELSYSQVVTTKAGVEKRVLDNGQTVELSLGNLLPGDNGEVILSASLRKDVANQKIFTTVAALKYQDQSGTSGEERAFAINTADTTGGFAAILGSNMALGIAVSALALIIIVLMLLLIRRIRRPAVVEQKQFDTLP